MTADVVVFPGDTILPIPVDRVLDGAKHCTEVLVLGWTEDGELWCSSSESEMAKIYWLLKKGEHCLLEDAVTTDG